VTPRPRSTGSWPPATDDTAPTPPAGSDSLTTVSTVNHSNVSANYPVLKMIDRTSWFVANGLHVPPIAYKLRSLSDLPGLILQVAGTPTQGVLVLDRIGSLVQSKH